MRLFLGIEINNELKQIISEFLSPLQISSKGWERPDDYHQTLLFLGEVSVMELAIIKMRMDQFQFKIFELQTAGFEFFSRRILYLSFAPSGDLLELKKIVNRTFPEWIKDDEKEFVPHLTVKRWQRYEYDYLEKNISMQKFQSSKFEVTGLALFKSEKDFGNKKYHVIYRVGFL